MAVMDIQVLPLGTCSTSLSGLIVEAVKVVKESGLTYELTPMGTVVEGIWRSCSRWRRRCTRR